ncbi:MAG: hypothetical protein KGD60_14830 [Candidatus Thorarchaeota archaeon]|nr:hypothetical protein [Candidatus Thorarchaeota archaeon]
MDFIAETPDIELIPIEVKNAARPSGKDTFQPVARSEDRGSCHQTTAVAGGLSHLFERNLTI